MSEARIFLVVAVSKPDDNGGRLRPLPGAITSAKRMAEWAKANGYITLQITDEDSEPVSVLRIREALQRTINDLLDNQGIPITRVVIYFAGHGYADSGGRKYWLLTDWNAEPTEAINVQMLQRMLSYYNPIQVSLIGDACSEINEDSLEITGHHILRKPEEERSTIEVDQFFAAEAGQKAFMISAHEGEEAFCLFTETLLDALEGEIEDAFDTEIPNLNRVTSQSLRNYLVKAIPIEASLYNVEMTTDPKPGFSTDRVYSEYPILPLTTEVEFDSISDDVENYPITHSLNKSREERKFDKTGSVPEADLTDEFVENLDNDTSDRASANLQSSKPNNYKTSGRVTKKIDLRHEVIFRDSGLFKGSIPFEDSPLTRKLKEREAHRKASVSSWSKSPISNSFESKCGLLVRNTNVEQVISLQDALIVSDIDGKDYRVWLSGKENKFDNTYFSDLAVMRSNEMVSCVTVVKRFISALAFDELGVPSLRYYPNRSNPDKEKSQFLLDVIARMANRMLNSDEATKIAAQIRVGKHADLVLGCLAGYLYDSVGDVESIVRTASFYPEYNQPVPLDLAILSGGRISTDIDGNLKLDIPATKEREPRNKKEEEHSFTTTASAEKKAVRVAGRIPWMRGGWAAAAIATAADQATAKWQDRLIAFAPNVLDFPFSTIRTSNLTELKEIAAKPKH